MGELDLDVLKKCGMKLKMTDYDAHGNPVHLDLWVANWQCAISGAEPAYYDLPSTYPAFKPSDAFRSFQGKFVTVRVCISCETEFKKSARSPAWHMSSWKRWGLRTTSTCTPTRCFVIH